MTNEDLPSINDIVKESNLPSYKDFIEVKEEELLSVQDYISESVEEESLIEEEKDIETVLSETAPEWSELVRLVNDVRKDIPEIPEIRYYDEQLKELSDKLSQIQDLNEDKLTEIESKIPELPEVKYYDADIQFIYDKIGRIKEEIDSLPEVKYYESDLNSLKSRIEEVNQNIPTFPDWVQKVQEVPDFSWIDKTFSIIDDDFNKVQGHLDLIREKIDYRVNELNDTIATKEFELKIDVKDLTKNFDQTVVNLEETKDKLLKQVRDVSTRIWEQHNEFKDDDRKLKKSIISEQNKLKQSLQEQIKEIDSQSVKADEALLKFFNDLNEEVKSLPEVKYYDKDISKVNKNITSIKKELKELSKLASVIKTEQVELKENYLFKELPEQIKEEEERSGDQVDPLTPMDQNFLTLNDLSNHYRLFINRIQHQLASLGGGGETRLEFLDDVDRDTAKVNGKFLKYDSSSGKWVGASASGGSGSQTLDETLDLGNTSSTGMSVGVVTATNFVGDVTGTATTATNLNNQAASYYLDYDNFTNTPTIPTNTNQLTNGAGFITTSFTNTNQLTNGAGFITSSDDISGTSGGLTGSPSITVTDITAVGNVSIAGTLTYEDVTNIDSIGIVTARTGVRVLTGTATTALVVEGNARVTGILTVGSSSLTLDGTNNVVNVGTALTLGQTNGIQFHTQNLHSQGFEVNNVNVSGIVTATSGFVGNLTGNTTGTSAGLTGTPDIIVDDITAGSVNVSGIVTATNIVSVKSDDGTSGRLDLYCETNNAHYARLQAPDHGDFSGNPTIKLPATAGTLLLNDGSGVNLTSLNASELDSGTIPDARFPATLPAASGTNLTNLPAANITGTLPAISGVNLTGVVTSITAGSNITLTGGPTGAVTIAASGGSSSNSFETIAVSGQSDVVADSATDTLTLVAGSNMTITTNAGGDSITFASSGGGGGGDTVSIESSATDILSVSSGAISADDAGADKLVFWDDSAGKLTYLTVGSNLTVTNTTISASGGGGGGAIGIQSGGTEITSSAGTINFVGTGITMADDGAVTDISIPSAIRTTNRYIATANQTTFSATYTVGYVDVFLNGIKLDGQDEFTATNGTSVVLTDGATVNDIVEIVAQQISANLTITGISNVVEDTTPQLGGDLDVNGKNINGTGDVNLTGIVTATTFSGGTFSGNVDLSGLLKEGVNITAGKLSDNTGIDLANGMVHLFTTEETTTSTPNLVFGGSSVNAKMSIGEAITVVIITTADATGYSAELTIDSSAVTEEWLGGSAPSEGGAGGYDVYTYNIIKTSDATYVVLSNLVNFA